MIRARAASRKPKAGAWLQIPSPRKCPQPVGLANHRMGQFAHNSWPAGAAANRASWVSVSGIPAAMLLRSRDLAGPPPQHHLPLFVRPWLEQFRSFRASCGRVSTSLVAVASVGVRELYRPGDAANLNECDFICSAPYGLALHYDDPEPSASLGPGQSCSVRQAPDLVPPRKPVACPLSEKLAHMVCSQTRGASCVVGCGT